MMRTSFVAAIFAVSLTGCAGGLTSYEGSFGFGQLPADDEPLRKWLAEQADVRDVSVTRQGNTIEVRYSRDEVRWEFKYLTPPFKDLGYEAPRGINWKSTRSHRFIPGIPDWLLLVLVIATLVALKGAVRLFGRLRSKKAEPDVAAGQPPE